MTHDDLARRLHGHLVRLYGEDLAGPTTARLVQLAERSGGTAPRELFDETDVLLIAYGDQVHAPDEAPLATLRAFLRAHTAGVVSGLHLLPHYPWTSDDGFAVSDYGAVDPQLGSWSDVEGLAEDYRLMLDAVLNHTSAAHPWFRGWLEDDPRYADFYLDVDPGADLGRVVRPRTSPLLTPFGAAGGERHVWTTFSADQVDLNYANPDVLVAATEVLLDYVARGASLLRLDAVAFLWKRVGGESIHEPETHEVIKLWRTLLDAVAPGTLLVTETNVPHRENVSYFGSGTDEAHVVYQFALPPLTLAAFHAGDAGRLAAWAAEVSTPSPQTTFLNFLASHDGIGVRPVEGILDPAEVDAIAHTVVERGGLVSHRTTPDGGQRPYELNSVYFDALGGAAGEDQQRAVDRFASAHAILLAMAGVPAFYFHSLFGSRNWTDGVRSTGRARTVNREKLGRARLEAELAQPGGLRRQVLDRLLALTTVRVGEPAFHPAAPQHVLTGDAAHFAVQRTATPDDGTRGTSVLCVHDVSGSPGRFRGTAPDGLPPGAELVDLVDGSRHVVEVDGTVDVDVPAYGVRWLRAG